MVAFLIQLWRGDPEEVTAMPIEADVVKPAREDGGLIEHQNLDGSVVPITGPVRPPKREEDTHLAADQQDLPKRVAWGAC